nr:MAG TPA_asm: Thaumarchaeal output domain 1 [Caudoviricetes sp.]
MSKHRTGRSVPLTIALSEARGYELEPACPRCGVHENGRVPVCPQFPTRTFLADNGIRQRSCGCPEIVWSADLCAHCELALRHEMEDCS